MAKQKISITIDEELINEIKSRYGDRQLSHVINKFCKQGLEGDLGMGPNTQEIVHACGPVGLAKKEISELCDVLGASFNIDLKVRIDESDKAEYDKRCSEFVDNPEMSFTDVDFYQSARDESLRQRKSKK